MIRLSLRTIVISLIVLFLLIPGLSSAITLDQIATTCLASNVSGTCTECFNSSYWTGTNYNESYWTGTNYNASYWTGTNYNASYEGASNYNASYLTSANLVGYATEAYVVGQGFITSTYNATYDAKTNYNASYWTGTNYNASYLTSTYNSTYDGQSNYNASYLTSTYNATYDAKADSNYNASYWTGTNYNATYDGQSNYNASYLTSTFNSTYDAKPDSTYNATYNAFTNYNASYITSTYNSTYDAKTNYNASYLTSTYNSTYDTKAPSAVFGYLTLMAGSGMVRTTNPGTMNQWETTTNKNNFIYWNFTDGGSETVQWIVDFPADWNASANVIFTPVWTAQDGSGTVNFTVKAKLFANDDALDTALATVGTSIDTLITAGDLHVSPDTTGAAISPVSSGGNTAIIQVSRDSTADTLSGTAQLLGLRIKYAKTMVAV